MRTQNFYALSRSTILKSLYICQPESSLGLVLLVVDRLRGTLDPPNLHTLKESVIHCIKTKHALIVKEL